MSLTIITNNHERDVLYGHELTDAERAEFDYIDWEAEKRGEILSEFVRYKGELYDLHDMERSNVPGWDSMVTDTFFSAVLFRWPREGRDGIDGEHIICGRCYAS